MSSARTSLTQSSTGTVVRLAIVGAGQISHRFLKQAAASQRVRMVATCARTLDSAKARAIEYGVDAWFDDYAAMYDRVAPDAVIIATPTALHAGPALAAFQRGIHVLCEKPMAATFEDCRAMVAAADRSGVVFLALPYDMSPAFMAALPYVNEETLGVLVGAEAQLLLPGPSRDNWYYDCKLAGGGAGLDTLVYPVSRLVNMLGPASRVSGFVNTLIPHRILGNSKTADVVPPPRDPARGKTVESTVDDNATLVIEWAGGQQAVVRALWGTSIVRFNETVIYGRRGTLWLHGNDVMVHSPDAPPVNAKPATWQGHANCYRVPVPLKPGHEYPRDEGLVEHFVDCIQGLGTATCAGRQQLHVHEILFKGYEAAQTGRTQQLETTFIPWRPVDAGFHDARSRLI
jgi:predicted dehydrogenase